MKFILGILFVFITVKSSVDIVIYSFNRPMQLFACLESIENQVSNACNIYVIYKCSDEIYNDAYNKVIHFFKNAIFFKQDIEEKGKDFKPYLLNILKNNSCKHIGFVVDDLVVKGYVDLKIATRYLDASNEFFAFFLRLGKNISFCYSLKIETIPPCKLLNKNDDVYYWSFNDGMLNEPGWQALTLGDWNFATSNDFTIYRKHEVYFFLSSLNFCNTSYEGLWWEEFRKRQENLKRKGLCFGESKAVNLCVNIANKDMANYNQFSDEWKKNNLDLYSTESLLRKFNEGFKIDLMEIYKIKNMSPHIEFNYNFVKR